MPNLIRQITFERPTPQRIDWAVPRDVDPLVATWTAVFYTERNRTIRAPERRRIDHGHYFGDLNNGPSTISEPAFSWWQPVVDAIVSTWAGTLNAEQTRTYRAPERRRIDHGRYFGDLNNGPSILDEPSFAWNWEGAVEPYLVKSIIPPIYEMPAEYRAPDPRKVDVRGVSEPNTEWLDTLLDSLTPFDPSIYQGIQDELRALRAREPKKLYGTVDEPEFGWLWEDTVEPFITSIVMPPIYEVPAEYRTPEPGKVKLITEPETDWLQSSLVVTFDPSIYIAAFQDYSLLTPNSSPPLRLTAEPEFIWRDLYDFMRWPAIEQMLTRAYRSTERSKIFAPSITEPWAPGNFEAADNFISLYTPSLWTPKDRAPEGQKLKVIYGPDDSPWIYPLVPVIVTFDSALWPAIEEQLHAFSARDRKKIEAWLTEPEFTWQYLVNDRRTAILYPATVEPSFRTRDRAYLELRKMYLSDYGWLTLNIPAPPAIATGIRHKRKWRRSG